MAWADCWDNPSSRFVKNDGICHRVLQALNSFCKARPCKTEGAPGAPYEESPNASVLCSARMLYVVALHVVNYCLRLRIWRNILKNEHGCRIFNALLCAAGFRRTAGSVHTRMISPPLKSSGAASHSKPQALWCTSSDGKPRRGSLDTWGTEASCIAAENNPCIE